MLSRATSQTVDAVVLQRLQATGQDTIGQDRTGQDMTGQDKTGQAGQGRTGEERTYIYIYSHFVGTL